jgi:hypothetical protein
MPVKYQGRRIVASKTVLRAHFTTPSPRPAASRHRQSASTVGTAPPPPRRDRGRPPKSQPPAIPAVDAPPVQPEAAPAAASGEAR